MKLNQLFFGLALLFVFFLLSFQNDNNHQNQVKEVVTITAPAPVKYQHMTIYSKHHDHDEVYVCMDGKEYNKLKLVKQIKGALDMNPLINLIHQYENEGWELMSIESRETTFIWLRRVQE